MLSKYDYLVIGFYFLYMGLIGWICRKFITNTSDYFRGGGKMLWWMAGCTAFVSQFSAWTFTGAASKAYQDGPVIMILYFANAVGFFFNFIYFAPRFRQMRVITSLQGVRARFGKANEQFFTWIQLPVGIVYAGIWLSGLAVFISAAFGINMYTTIIAAGTIVLIMAVIGGSWAVAAGDFIQTLVLMPITIVVAVLSIAQVGGWNSFVKKLPSHHLHWTEGARVEILYLWIIAVIIKQFISTNNMLEASRYLNAKDSKESKKAALLASILFIIGPVFWFIPPMVARIMHPDLHAVFPNLKNPGEGAFVMAGLDNMPAGMLGLLISGIFGATMSHMDVGLNRNAGFFVKNFYQIVIRPHSTEREMLYVSKVVTFLFGILVILVALVFSKWELGLFNLMLLFGSLIAVPYSIPLIWGTVIKRAPVWAGWTTVLVGFATSLTVKLLLTKEWIEWVSQHLGLGLPNLANTLLNPAWLQKTMGWTTALSKREGDDWLLIVTIILNVIFCSLWFFGTCLFAKSRKLAEVEQVDNFFKQMQTPVDYDKEEGGANANDGQQYRTLGLMALVYGAFISLLVLIPNPIAGRIGMFACAGAMLTVGALLYWNYKKHQAKQTADRISKNHSH